MMEWVIAVYLGLYVYMGFSLLVRPDWSVNTFNEFNDKVVGAMHGQSRPATSTVLTLFWVASFLIVPIASIADIIGRCADLLAGGRKG